MGKSGSAPKGYQPTWQAGADQNFSGLIQNATPYVQNLPGQVIPGLESAAGAINNNPYFGQAMNGAQLGAGIGQNTATTMGAVVPSLNNMGYWAQQAGADTASRLWGMGQVGANYGQSAVNSAAGARGVGQRGYNETQGMIPGGTQGLQALAGLTGGAAMSAIPGLTGGMDAAGSILNTGFDPQHALYDRNYQQMMDQQNALNSMYGLNDSAYGAGVAGQASRNFNLDWQNNQLSRQISALGAYGQQQSTVGNNLTSLLGSAANNYGNLTNSAVNNLNSLVNTGSNAYNSGVNTYLQGIDRGLAGNAQNMDAQINANNVFNNSQESAANLWGQAGNIGSGAAQLAAASANTPSALYTQQQQNWISALQALASGGSQALQPTSMLGGLDSNYMQLGQGATQLAQNAAKINQASAGGLGSMLGSIAGLALAPMTGGASLFGMGAGLFGSMAGGAGGAAGGAAARMFQ